MFNHFMIIITTFILANNLILAIMIHKMYIQYKGMYKIILSIENEVEDIPTNLQTYICWEISKNNKPVKSDFLKEFRNRGVPPYDRFHID